MSDIDFESLRETTLLVLKLKDRIAAESKPYEDRIAEIQTELDSATRKTRGLLQTTEALLEQIRLDVSEALTAKYHDRLARLATGEKVPEIEKPVWLTVTKTDRVVVVDRDLIPEQFWTLDEKALKKEKTETPGTRRELVLGLQVQSKKL